MGKEIQVKSTMEIPMIPDANTIKQMQKLHQSQQEKQNSFVFRRAGPNTEVKIYFLDVGDLIRQLMDFDKESTFMADKLDGIKSKFIRE